MSKIKTQEEIGLVYLEKKGLDKERFKNLIKGHEVYCRGIEKSLRSEDLFIENWLTFGEYVWLSSNRPLSDSKLITLDELEEMITGENKTEKIKFKTGDKVRVKSIFNTQRGYGWDEDMVDVGGCFFVGTCSSSKVEDEKHPFFSYHVDDLELVENSVLPEKWYVKVTEENKEVLSKWRFEKVYKSLEVGEIVGMCGYPHGVMVKGHNPCGEIKSDRVHVFDFGEEITFEQFKKHVLKGEEMKVLKVGDKVEICGIPYMVSINEDWDFWMTNVYSFNEECFEIINKDGKSFQKEVLGYDDDGNFPVCNSLEDLTKFVNAINEEYQKQNKMDDKKVITAEEAQSIINIACSDWKAKLAELWAVSIVQGKGVEITNYFYKKMRSACTKEQHKLFDKIFGEDEPESPYQDGELIFIRTSNSAEWSLRYSTGKINKNGYAEVYNNQKLYTKNTTPFKFHAKAPNVKLPE